MKLYIDEETHIYVIPSCQEIKVYDFHPSRDHKYKFEILYDENTRFRTCWSEIHASTKLPLLEFFKTKIRIDVSSKDYRDCDGFEFNDRQKSLPIINKAVKNMIFEVYVDHIVLNKTCYDLVFNNNYVARKNHIGFFYSKKPVTKIRLAEDNEWSQEFNINAIGTAGAISLKRNINPKKIQFGIQISTAPNTLLKTKLIIISPRYIITNYLGYSIQIRQYINGESGSDVLDVKNRISLPLQLREAKIMAIQISEEGQIWSGPFNVENFHDFQVRFCGRDLNLSVEQAKKKWYLPNTYNNLTHFARVIITSDDDATIHINLLTPKEPEFVISNQTPDQLIIKQNHDKHFSQSIPAFSAVPFAYVNLLETNKKISVIANNISQNYTLDKFKDKRDLGAFKVELLVYGITRELRIKSKNDDTKIEKSLCSLRKEGCHMCINLYGIGISLIDDKPSEILYASLSQINLKIKRTEEVFFNSSNQRLKLDFKLGNFQIDNMDCYAALYPVIFSVLPNKKDENTVTPFLQVKIIKEKYHYKIENTVKSIEKIK